MATDAFKMCCVAFFFHGMICIEIIIKERDYDN